MQIRVLIPNFGMGNLHSVKRSLHHLNVHPIISADPGEIAKADKIILPGVGHFQTAMQNLASLNMIDALHEFALVKQKPILGICLGMQVMAKSSEEGNAIGLGWIDAAVIRFRIKDTLHYKIPHIGWSGVNFPQSVALFNNIPANSEFYFIHSYHFGDTPESDVAGETVYETRFISAIAKNNIMGVQFHPEKSHHTGSVLMKNFIVN